MNSFCLMLKQFYKNWITLTVSIAFFVISFGYTIYSIVLCSQQNLNPLNYLSQTLSLSMFSFVFFLFISNEFLNRTVQNGMQAVPRTIKNSSCFFMLGFSVMVFVLVLYTLLLLIMNIVIYFILDVKRYEYLLHIIYNIFLNIFFVSLIGILFGGIMSMLKSRITAYLIMVVLFFLASPAFDLISITLFEGTGVNIFWISDFFNIFPPLLQWDTVSSFGYSLLPYRVELLLFYLFLCSSILIFMLFKNKRIFKFTSLGCFIVCGVFLFNSLQPSSKVVMNQDPRIGAMADAWYYQDDYVIESTPQFSINEYNMTVCIDRQLEVVAELTLDKNNISDYEFTLYHGYIISNVTNQSDQPLEFSQNGDYFTIHCKDSLNKIKITYSGSSPKFFSNNQGTVLPGWFAYYPHPGKLRMFNSSEQSFERITCSENTKFSVNIISKKEIYCNLNKSGDNKFSGMSNGITLVSGFYKTMQCEGIEIVYPYLETNEFTSINIPEYIKQYKADGILKSNIKKVFILPNMNNTSVYERFCALEDHITLRQLIGLPMIYEMQKIPSYKLSLFNSYEYYKKNPDDFYNMVNDRKELYEGEDIQNNKDIYVLLEAKLKEFGDEYVKKEVETYLSNYSDTREDFVFLNELKGD